jgi:hypothetical protein
VGGGVGRRVRVARRPGPALPRAARRDGHGLGIAQRLGTRISTVEKHLSVITDKLGLPSAGDTIRPGVNMRVLAALTFLGQLDEARN